MRLAEDVFSAASLETFEGRPLLRDTDPAQPWHPAQSALFPMLPLANRVAGNLFELWGEACALPASELDPDFFLHGDGWLQRWQPVALTDSSVTLQLTSQKEKIFEMLVDTVVPDFSYRWLLEGKREYPELFPWNGRIGPIGTV